MEKISKLIGAVVVTYNRLNDLQKALAAYEQQSLLPGYIVVVNNNSNDGTKEFLEEWLKVKKVYKKYVLHLQENTGGSGGFYNGLNYSMSLNRDWVWIADDDAFPDKDAFKILDAKVQNCDENVQSVCATVVSNNEVCLHHRANIKVENKEVKYISVPESMYEREYFACDVFSYVGAVIRVQCLKKVGLTEKDFFICCDDIEHGYRISRLGKILCCPQAKVYHNEIVANSSDDQITWKRYYDARNRTYFEKKYFPELYKRLYWKTKVDCYMHFLMFRKVAKYKLILAALEDADKGRLGVHDIYKPGWKINGQ